MSEFPVLSRDDLDADQRAFWDEITLGPRGFYTGGADTKRLPDLYNAWMQFPGLGRSILHLADDLRAQSDLNGRLRELVVLTSSIVMGARVEYEFHIPFARDQGLSEAVIEAIGRSETPVFTDDVERIVHDATLQFLRTFTLTDQTRDEVIEAIGLRGLTQLIAALVIYVATAFTTNVAKVKLADDFSADPAKLKDFYAGRKPSAD